MTTKYSGYTVVSLISLQITQTFHLLLGFAKNRIVFWDFKIQNSIHLTEGLDNGDSDNQGPTVYTSQMSVPDINQKYFWINQVFRNILNEQHSYIHDHSPVHTSMDVNTTCVNM